MVGKFPRLFVAEEVPAPDSQSPEPEGFGRVFDRVRAVLCGLHGHDNLLQFDRDRMYLKCTSCGYESPGWELNDAPRPKASRTEDSRPISVPSRPDTSRRIA